MFSCQYLPLVFHLDVSVQLNQVGSDRKRAQMNNLPLLKLAVTVVTLCMVLHLNMGPTHPPGHPEFHRTWSELEEWLIWTSLCGGDLSCFQGFLDSSHVFLSLRWKSLGICTRGTNYPLSLTTFKRYNNWNEGGAMTFRESGAPG